MLSTFTYLVTLTIMDTISKVVVSYQTNSIVGIDKRGAIWYGIGSLADWFSASMPIFDLL